MADVTNEFMFEVLKSTQADIKLLKDGLGEIKHEIASIRLSQLSTHSDIHNIYGILARQDERFDRIERRLELRELAEPQRPYDPQ